MKSTKLHSSSIKTLLKQHKIADMEKLKDAVGTDAPATVHRKLGELDYITSYSHGGRYYTLLSNTRFNEKGLWTYKTVHFSQYGTLMETLKVLIQEVENGYFGDDLRKLLHVNVDPTLLKLFKQNKVAREKYLGRYLYCSTDLTKRKHQLANRKSESAFSGTRSIVMGEDWVSNEIKAAIILFVGLLDEKQRRLFAGLESMQFGHGGDKWISELLDVDAHTVAKGRRQLIEQDVQLDGVRSAGAGRPKVKKNARNN